MKRILLFILAIYPLSAQPFLGLPVAEILPDQVIRELKNQGKVIRYTEHPEALALAPDLQLPEFRTLISASPRFLSEGLFFFPLSSKTIKKHTQEELDLIVYNIIRDIPSMEGLPFVNPLNGDRETLFEIAYRIPSIHREDMILPVRPLNSIPEHELLYMYIEESQFGESRYTIDLETIEIRKSGRNLNIFNVSLNNLDRMTFLKLPAIGEKELKVSLTVFSAEMETARGIEQGHILYGVWAVDVSDRVPILFIKPQDLFFSRMESLYEWFRERYGEIE